MIASRVLGVCVRLAAALLTLAFFAAAPGPSTSSPAGAAPASSLPSVSSGARPGPDVLYAPPPDAPQLENRDPRFSAAPLLVSGQEAYVDGEYLYQDFLYDDYGSDTDGDGNAPLSPRRGDIEYPTDFARYGGNAADLVEFRIDLAPDSVAYRITLNALLQPDSTMVAIAFDTDRNAPTGTSLLPRDPGAPFPGTDEVIFVWGTGGEHVDIGVANVITPIDVSADLEANQITAVVPRAVSDPSGVWRTTVAVGLRNAATGGWLRPGATATATTPGGAGPLDPSPAGIFNLAFRFNEPFVNTDVPPDADQALAIRNKTPTQYARDIDFDALAAGRNSTTVPSSGVQIRMFPSRLQLGEGRDLNTFPAYLGQLQPYAIYVPSGSQDDPPAGLVLALHSLSEHYWQYNGTLLHQQFGEQRGAFVATSLSRGDDGWYRDVGEYDVFEMWNDIASHFSLDPEKVVLTGYSMGGYATYRFGTLYPDLFGKAFSVVGPPGEGIWVPPLPPTGARDTDTNGAAETLTNNWIENARNLPFMNLASTADELVPYAGPHAQNLGRPDLGIRGFDQHGYRFHFLTFDVADHFALALLDYDFPMAAGFLGDADVNRNPYHVTFSYTPAADFAPLGLVHDHAYWVSDLSLADPERTPFPAEGTIDVLSHAFGLGDPASAPGQFLCVVPGTPPECGPLPYTEINRTWADPPAIPVANRLDVTLTNLNAATIDARRAGLDLCEPISLIIDADSAGHLLLAGPLTASSVAGAAFEQSAAGVTLIVPAGHSQITITPSCPQPDLTVTSIVASNNRAPQGEKVTITATIANAGTAHAGASQTQFSLDGATSLGLVATPPLPAGDSTLVSVDWQTAGVKGDHTISVLADAAGNVDESDETNNAAALTVLVRGNKVQNGSFESSSSGTEPDHWSSSGNASYTTGGSDGERSVSAGAGGIWTSEPIPVTAGNAYQVSIDSAGAAGTLVVEQLSPLGLALVAVQVPLIGGSDQFQTVNQSLTIVGGVTQVRLLLLGAPGGVTFDNVQLFEH
jgi:hypothetical protein